MRGPETTRGGTVEFQVSGPADRTSTGTLYGRGVSPTVDASPAEVRPERRNPPSPRPHPSVVTADTEGAMTDAHVSRETEDPPLAQEAKRAVEILNPSGEITMPRPPRRRTMCVANQKGRSEEHTSELQSLTNLVCRLLLEIGRAHV